MVCGIVVYNDSDDWSDIWGWICSETYNTFRHQCHSIGKLLFLFVAGMFSVDLVCFIRSYSPFYQNQNNPVSLYTCLIHFIYSLLPTTLRLITVYYSIVSVYQQCKCRTYVAKNLRPVKSCRFFLKRHFVGS